MCELQGRGSLGNLACIRTELRAESSTGCVIRRGVEAAWSFRAPSLGQDHRENPCRFQGWVPAPRGHFRIATFWPATFMSCGHCHLPRTMSPMIQGNFFIHLEAGVLLFVKLQPEPLRSRTWLLLLVISMKWGRTCSPGKDWI